MTTTAAVFTYYYPDGRTEIRPEPLAGRGAIWVRGSYSPPVYPNPVNVRVGEAGVHVWMVIGWLKDSAWDLARVQSQYATMLHPDDVAAAEWYYKRYGAEIDARLAEEGWGS